MGEALGEDHEMVASDFSDAESTQDEEEMEGEEEEEEEEEDEEDEEEEESDRTEAEEEEEEEASLDVRVCNYDCLRSLHIVVFQGERDRSGGVNVDDEVAEITAGNDATGEPRIV